MNSGTISHYRIIKELGAGGMGEVYLAEDVRLGREVALKFLPASYQYDPDRRTKFLAEARATSALRSPHIAAIYDIGEHEESIFIVMEYVEGELLSAKLERGPLALSESIDIAAQIADALSEAHTLGIVHCDIKSSNLIINDRGFVKVLDFGIARMAERSSQSTDDRTKKLGQQTAFSAVLGTVSYMSPEQAIGRAVDHRSDIFSLGVVLYEMLTARLPFDGETAVEVIDKIIHEEPVAVARLNYSVPPELERILRKCLEKDRDRRYQSTRELLVDLNNLRRDSDSSPRTIHGLNRNTQVVRRKPQRRGINSLAILPLINMSGELDAEYLSDGITETLINNLSKIPKLRVMARSTVFRYKGQATEGLQNVRGFDPIQVGLDLGVRAVFIGRVFQRDDALIIKAELVDAIDGSHLWGGQFTRQMKDIFAIEEEISQEITENLRLKLTGAQKKQLAQRYTENTEAYQLYLKGRYHWNKRTQEGITKGIEFFDKAIALDPNYALAYAGLADCYNLLASYSTMSPRTAFLRAKATVMKALKLDPLLAEANASLAHIRFWYEWDWNGAERDFKKALELNPGYGTAHLWYSLYLIAMERVDEAISEVKQAQELDPLAVVINLNVSRVLYFARQYDQAAEQCLKTLELYPNFFLGHRRLGQIYERKQMYDEALKEFALALALAPNNSETISVKGYTLAAAGRIAEAEQVLEELKELSKQIYVSPYSLSRVLFALGKDDEAFGYLEQTYKERHGILVYLKVEPLFDNLRQDPRLISMLERLNLAD